MPISYKTLGQSAPLAVTDTDVYVVPTNTECIVSSITVCNRGTTEGTYRVAVRPNGASLSNQHYVFFDVPLPAKSTDALTLGITIDAADVITVQASNANFSFGIYGTELT